ncbi:MAG: peptidase [Acidobacteria bacterium]|nr:peptidase [Acidobacteriota bacterium]
MLIDLDRLMRERGIEALLVPMHEALHPSFRWLTRGALVTRGYAIKVAGADPILYSYPMEREEAAATGLATRMVHDYGYERIFRNAPNAAEAYAELFDELLRDLNVQGAVAFFGNVPIQLYQGVLESLTHRGREIYRSNGEDLIQLARKRKEPWEVAAIASVGERTERVVASVRAVLREASIRSGILQYEGRALKLGDLKSLVSSEIARLGMVEDHETILSQGRDAGIPHSRGDAAAEVRAGVPIVLDIFPADKESGYFFDLTRTFCAGDIPDELQRIHADVLAAHTLAAEAMRPGTEAKSYQAAVCDYFEPRGYATTRSHPATLEGYVHSLGHGVGLEIHEKPSFALTPANHDLIETGDIVTIEPGLYFPERELGVRIEDTFVVENDGVRSLSVSDRSLKP